MNSLDRNLDRLMRAGTAEKYGFPCITDVWNDVLKPLEFEREYDKDTINDLKSEISMLKEELANIKSVYDIEERQFKCLEGVFHHAVYNQAAYSMISKYKDTFRDKMLLSDMNKKKLGVSKANEKGYKLAIREMKKQLKKY